LFICVGGLEDLLDFEVKNHEQIIKLDYFLELNNHVFYELPVFFDSSVLIDKLIGILRVQILSAFYQLWKLASIDQTVYQSHYLLRQLLKDMLFHRFVLLFDLFYEVLEKFESLFGF